MVIRYAVAGWWESQRPLLVSRSSATRKEAEVQLKKCIEGEVSLRRTAGLDANRAHRGALRLFSIVELRFEDPVEK